MSDLVIKVFDVEHGACTMIQAPNNGALAMVDSGSNSTTGWRPSAFIRHVLGRTQLDYLVITNADQDHLSDLQGLWDFGVNVVTLYRNYEPPPAQLRALKEEQGELTQDIERYLDIHTRYNGPVALPFEQNMGGATLSVYCNSYADFTDTNNLSLVAFLTFGGFKMCFPGDLEVPGWRHHGLTHVDNGQRIRHVLTTRRDGNITFLVGPDGNFRVSTQS